MKTHEKEWASPEGNPAEETKKESLIADALKEECRAESDYGKTIAFGKLKQLVSNEMYYIRNNDEKYYILSGEVEEAVLTTTEDLFVDIYDGKFDNKEISLETYCKARLYKLLAAKYGIQKDFLHRIYRVRKLSETYGIPIVMSNAWLFSSCSELDGYSTTLGITECMKCISYIIIQQRTNHGINRWRSNYHNNPDPTETKKGISIFQ